MRRLPIVLVDVRAGTIRDRRTLRVVAALLRCTLLIFFGGSQPRYGERADVLGDERFFDRYDEELTLWFSKRP